MLCKLNLPMLWLKQRADPCHKAQGGQWDAVFIDPGWQGEDSHDDEYWRWLYTAFTRARKKLYLINFKDEMIEALED